MFNGEVITIKTKSRFYDNNSIIIKESAETHFSFSVFKAWINPKSYTNQYKIFLAFVILFIFFCSPEQKSYKTFLEIVQNRNFCIRDFYGIWAMKRHTRKFFNAKYLKCQFSESRIYLHTKPDLKDASSLKIVCSKQRYATVV